MKGSLGNSMQGPSRDPQHKLEQRCDGTWCRRARRRTFAGNIAHGNQAPITSQCLHTPQCHPVALFARASSLSTGPHPHHALLLPRPRPRPHLLFRHYPIRQHDRPASSSPPSVHLLHPYYSILFSLLFFRPSCHLGWCQVPAVQLLYASHSAQTLRGLMPFHSTLCHHTLMGWLCLNP